jgi:hypothetical protein
MSEPPDPGKEPRPVRLEYFAADAPRDPRTLRLRIWWTLLALGWLPFACGVATSRSVALSGVADVVRVHVHAGAMFMAIGALTSLACLIGFLRSPNKADWASATIAAVCLILQIFLFLCVGALSS